MVRVVPRGRFEDPGEAVKVVAALEQLTLPGFELWVTSTKVLVRRLPKQGIQSSPAKGEVQALG